MKELDNFFSLYDAHVNGCFLALREIILLQDADITSAWKYGMPFFCYKGKMFCYLWYHKKYKKPYLGIVEGNRIEHPELIQEKRSRMKIILFEPSEDLPIDTINYILQEALNLYRLGIIRVG